MSGVPMTTGRALAVLAAGALFGFGLSLSTMVRPEVVLGFLRWQDMGLMLVMGGAVLVTLLAYRFGPALLRQADEGPGPRRRVLVVDQALAVRSGLASGAEVLVWPPSNAQLGTLFAAAASPRWAVPGLPSAEAARALASGIGALLAGRPNRMSAALQDRPEIDRVVRLLGR